MHRDGQNNRLAEGRARDGQDRQRQEEADEDRDGGNLPVIRVGDRTGPGELGLMPRVEQAPIGTDAAFTRFPRLIERFDDVVVDAARFGLGGEVANDRRLLDRTGVGVAPIVAGARPSELGDDHTLAGERAPQFVVPQHRLIDGLALGDLVPVGQNVGRDVVDGVDELRMGRPG